MFNSKVECAKNKKIAASTESMVLHLHLFYGDLYDPIYLTRQELKVVTLLRYDRSGNISFMEVKSSH